MRYNSDGREHGGLGGSGAGQTVTGAGRATLTRVGPLLSVQETVGQPGTRGVGLCWLSW